MIPFLNKNNNLYLSNLTLIESLILRKRIYLLVCISFLLLGSCSGGIDLQKRNQSCMQSQKLLRKRVGPEFGKLHFQAVLPLSNTHFGCAYVFTRVQEELPGEVLGDFRDAEALESQKEIAFVLPDASQQPILTLLSPPPYRKHKVEFDLRSIEILGGNPPELVIHERQKNQSLGYQGLRIFKFAPFVPSPQTLFSEELTLKTKEGLKLIPKWRVQSFEGKIAVVLSAGGEYKTYMWNDQVQRFILDLAASQRLNKQPLKSSQKTKKVQKSSLPSATKSRTSSSQPKPSSKSPKQESSSKKLNEILNDL